MKRALITIFAVFTITVSIAFGHSTIFAQDDNVVRVTLLHLNDTYQFVPADGGARGGLARVMTIKQNALKENPNTLMTLGGDTVSPSVETRTYRGKQMIDAWNVVGLDYSVLGNHEFDIRTNELLDRIKESKFTWLGANVFDKKTNKPFAELPPFVIRHIGGVKIGFIGFLLPEAKETSSMEDHIEVRDFCKAAKKLIPQMRKNGANVIVGLTHMFMYQDKQLAHCAPGIDLILGGHEHTLLQSSANGTPIFKMWADAREVGKFDLFVNKKTGKLESMDWEIIPVTDEIPDAPEFAVVFDKYKELLDQLQVRIGATSVKLDAFSHSVRTKETNIANFIADAYREAVDADVAFVNGGSIRADLEYNPGSLVKRDVLSLLPFNNPIIKIELTGKTLLAALEHGVARSGPGEDNEPGRFPQVSNINYTFDASRPVGQRITEVLIGGKPLDVNAKYTVATSDFLVTRAGDGYTMLAEGKILLDAEKAPKDSEVLENAIKNSPDSTISPGIEDRIKRIN